MENRVYNFSAGPATLPLPVLKEAQEHLLSLPGIGISVLEISHRSKAFTEIIEEGEANIRALLNVPDNYKVLFLHGGASLQFSMIPMNLLRGSGKTADYVITGSWGKKAIKEAKKEGSVNVAWDGAEGNYNRIPEQSELELTPSAAYVHTTPNETIQGVEFQTEPDTGDVPLISDMSSNFLSKPVDVSKYGLIYAGAQKNAGPAGVAIVILREDLLERAPENLPALLDYRTMAEGKSLYNTPPAFAIYMVTLVSRWLKNEIGGLEKMASMNREKAMLLYDAIDNSGGYYRGHAENGSRSMMNVAWRLGSEDLEKEFIQKGLARGLAELKGHRSVGGIRASIYNAMPREGIEALVEFMGEFKSEHGG